MGSAVGGQSLASLVFCSPPSHLCTRSAPPPIIIRQFPASHLKPRSALRLPSQPINPLCESPPIKPARQEPESSRPPRIWGQTSSKEASLDIKLPRRNLMVQFTCNACGERTQRTINGVAYEWGTVFLQCAGCLVYHKLVDNLALMVEYDLREDLGANSDTE